ncbi:GNAT family N-acetyltransferase [Pedobacter sp. WC2423]|uniref:GNAT family N-acetyltransferase n=1 Tax=Pedobacter sp. WC2423 TaxID=3234142 RepID=UPI0034659364
MKGLKVKFTPSQDDIAEIKSWLIAENESFKEGFYCNWSVILQSYEDKKLVVLISEQKAIGFITWREGEKVATIDIAEIKPELRKKGYGRHLAEKLFQKLLKRGFAVLDLHCQPAKSEAVWKRLGFVRFPDVKEFEWENSERGSHLYKIMVPHLKPTKSQISKESIYLWGVEPRLAEREAARWKWHPKFQKGTRKLMLPIVFPANRNWQISWSKNDMPIKTSKIKYFSRNEIDFKSFIIIEELPIT